MRQTPMETLIIDGNDGIVPGTGLGGDATEPEDFGQMQRGVVVDGADDDQSVESVEYWAYDSRGDLVCVVNLAGHGHMTAAFRQTVLVALRDHLDTIDPLPPTEA